VNTLGGDRFGHCAKKKSCEHVSNSEWLLFESPDLIPFDFCLWGWMQNEIYKMKGGYKRRIARSHFGCCCPQKENSDEQHTIFAHEWLIEADGGIFEHLRYCEL
jgi:hypothetical protein